MQLTVNGEAREVAEGLCVADLLEALHLNLQRVAVERNRTIVPRASYRETPLAAQDVLEIVSFVGGG